MGKRGAATSPCKPQPAAKARASLQAAFARSARDQVTPDIFSLDYEGWKLAVINQSSRQYYAQRTDGWMRALWEKAKANAGHDLAGAFLQSTHSVPAGKTPWVYNPKEICTIFETFVKERHETGVAHSSRTDSDQTATGTVVDAEETVGPGGHETSDLEKTIDTASDAQTISCDNTKPEKSDHEMVDAAAAAE